MVNIHSFISHIFPIPYFLSMGNIIYTVCIGGLGALDTDQSEQNEPQQTRNKDSRLKSQHIEQTISSQMLKNVPNIIFTTSLVRDTIEYRSTMVPSTTRKIGNWFGKFDLLFSFFLLLRRCMWPVWIESFREFNNFHIKRLVTL